MVMRMLAIKENPVFIDSTDALAVALCHYHNKQSSLDGPSPLKQLRRRIAGSSSLKAIPRCLTVN